MQIQDEARTETAPTAESSIHDSDDLLWRHLKTVPAFRALLRAVEARFYRTIDLPPPILDLGCGDGHFAHMTFTRPLTAGVDPWWGPLQKAQRTGAYRLLLQGLGHRLPFPDAHFATVFSNSVLEHIADVQPVLNEASRVLQADGRLVITVPSHYFTAYLGGANVLEKVGLGSLAHGYRRFFNFISRHAHTDSPQLWASRLAQAGFSVERWQYYFSPAALRALEWGHVQGLPSAVLHFLTGHWVVAPWRSNLKRTEQWLRPFYEEEASPQEGAYMLFVARKQTGGPIEASLPPARPFTLAELTEHERERKEATQDTVAETPGTEPDTVETPVVTTVPEMETAEPEAAPPSADRQEVDSKDRSPSANLVSMTLLAVSLLCAIVGQSILSRHPPQPGAGLRWYAYSLVALLALVWHRGTSAVPLFQWWRRPRPAAIPRRRWLVLAGLLLAFVAQRIASTPSSGAIPALILWLVAIATTFYALAKPGLVEPSLIEATPANQGQETADTALPGSMAALLERITPFALLVTVVLFLAALTIRAIGLTQHPFILNGTEAGLGLDVANVANGTATNPFATGWLTNPTLPMFVLAIPLELLGRSVLAIRFLSPFIGALTVVTVFWIGRGLWGQAVGLVAAVLLLGSHFHLHYSRLGMTNIWDPLFTLLALGLIGLAWQQHGQATTKRLLWLAAGVAVGLNAYFFTSSHLLPLMLAALLLLALLFDRNQLQSQWPHLLAAAVMALVVALPQMLYYNNHPTVFMERANGLGILDGQSGWLSQEAARTGLSRGQIWRQQWRQAALAFNYSLDQSSAYNPQAPLLTLGPAVFFVFGLVMAVWHWRQWRYRLLLVWVLVTVVFAGALLVEPPSSHRLVIVAPALSLLAAVALVRLGEKGVAIVWPGDGGQQTAVSQHCLLAGLLAVAVLFTATDIAFYFGRYRLQHSFGDRNTEIADAMADYLNNLDSQWTAYFYGPPSMYVSFPTIPFLATDFQAGVNLFDVPEAAGTEELPPAGTPNRVFIFLPERGNELTAVEEAYPGGQVRTVPGFYANPLFYAYEVPQSGAALRGKARPVLPAIVD